jgi:pre-mRNA-processing factor 19
VRIWDARKNENAATFAEHASEASSNDCAVRFLCFSENGYTLATAAGDDCVRLFDLRKLKLVQTVPAQGGVAGLAFDQSGKLLAFGNGAGSVSVATAKPWNVIAKLEGPTNITGLKFGPSLEFLACVAMDR